MTNKEGHIKLWDELARTGAASEEKFTIFYNLFPNAGQDASENACFACAEAKARFKRRTIKYCRRCPITWGKKDSNIDGYFCERLKDTPFGEWKWNGTLSKTERKRLAAIIRDLPWE